MAERQINIKVENLVPILQEGCDEIVCGNGTYTVLFDFDEEWAGLNTKTAIFVCGDTPLYSVFEGNICNVPEIDGGTVCYVGVVSGSIEDINEKADKRTTVWCIVKAKPSITSIAKEPLPPSQDVYVEFMALLNKYIISGGGGTGELIVDQEYNPESVLAQSGKAVEEAITPLKEKDEAIFKTLSEQSLKLGSLGNLPNQFEDVKKTVENQNTSITIALQSSSEAKTKVNAFGDVVQSLVQSSGEIRDLLWQETQRATTAEVNLQNTKQDKLAFDGTYNEYTNRVATMESVAKEVARIVANAPADFDTLKEIADWLQNHSADATQMNSRINDNATAIAQINIEQTAQSAKIEQVNKRIDDVATSANNATNIANTTLSYSSEAKQIAQTASAKVDRLEQNMPSEVVFDGDYNPETNKAATVSTVANVEGKIDTLQQDIDSALEELHNYAQSIISGGATE